MRSVLRWAAAIAFLIGITGRVEAAREPVLKQVDLPHNYYWRELYIPQLTTGPSSVSFVPDGKSLVYSMGGSLWRQTIGSDEAGELTHPRAAYDYQPDVANDGRSIVFSRYNGAGIELWRLDLADGREQALTSGEAVNVDGETEKRSLSYSHARPICRSGAAITSMSSARAPSTVISPPVMAATTPQLPAST